MKIADDIAHTLQGTCLSLSEALTRHDADEALADNADFCIALDDAVFCCDQCGWWHENSEMSSDDMICDGCYDERASNS